MQTTVPTRRLGRTNEHVSMVAWAGSISARHPEQRRSGPPHSSAIDGGITFRQLLGLSRRRSEERMGHALGVLGYRKRVFLMTKFDGRDRRTATAQLDESLRRLQTDHVDLWQIHENIRPDDADRVFAPGGAIEAMLAAQRSRQGPLPRLHRPQRSRHITRTCSTSPRTTGSVRHRADAAQHHGRALPEFRAQP